MRRDVLMSLNPQWFGPIMQGKKTIEVRKPTLGCSPYYVNISARINELCEAIKRCSTEKGYAGRIRLWCKEIALLVVMNDMLRQSEEKEDGHASA